MENSVVSIARQTIFGEIVVFVETRLELNESVGRLLKKVAHLSSGGLIAYLTFNFRVKVQSTIGEGYHIMFSILILILKLLKVI